MLTKQAFDHPSRYENGGIPFVKVDKTNVFELTVSGGTLVIFNTPPGAKIKFVAFKFCGNVIVDTGLTTVPLELIFNVVVCPIAYMVNSNTNRMLKMCFFIFLFSSILVKCLCLCLCQGIIVISPQIRYISAEIMSKSPRSTLEICSHISAGYRICWIT